jgi:hypothetical protein
MHMDIDKEDWHSDLARKQLVRESRWVREYRLPGGGRYLESKFCNSGLQVTLEEFQEMWQTYSPEEKREFLYAYSVKDPLSEEDRRLLRYLMENGSDEDCSLVALRITELPEAAQVLAFLVEKRESPYFANYAQALELIGGPDAYAVLEKKFAEYQLSLAGLPIPATPESLHDYAGYVACCEALINLTGSPGARAAVEAMLVCSDERVQSMARGVKARSGVRHTGGQDQGVSPQRS